MIATGRNCYICGRALKDYRICAPDDPAMDCGGDCLACMREIEEGIRRPTTLIRRIQGTRLLWAVTRGQWGLRTRLWIGAWCLVRGWWQQRGSGS